MLPVWTKASETLKRITRAVAADYSRRAEGHHLRQPFQQFLLFCTGESPQTNCETLVRVEMDYYGALWPAKSVGCRLRALDPTVPKVLIQEGFLNHTGILTSIRVGSFIKVFWKISEPRA